MSEYQTNKDTIERIPLFQCLTNKQKYSLSNAIKTINFKQNQIIFNVGDSSQALYIISEGEVKVEIPGKQPLFLNKN